VQTPRGGETRINYEEGRRRQPIPRKKPFVSFVGFATFVLTPCARDTWINYDQGCRGKPSPGKSPS
jgi:hypothetical protein